MTIETMEGPQTTTEAPPPPQAQNENATALSERHALALKLYLKYKDKGRIGGSTDWKQAFIDHPEAKQILGTNPTALIASMRRSGKVPGEKVKRQKISYSKPQSKGKTRKVMRALSAKSQRALDIMLQHGDENGYLDYDKLDAESPGWDNRIPSRKWLKVQTNAHRSTGLFKIHKQAKVAAAPAKREEATATTKTRKGHPPNSADRHFNPNPQMVRILDLMVKHANADGTGVSVYEMDAKAPGWDGGDNEFRKKFGNNVIYYRKSGNFKRYKDAQLASKMGTAAQPIVAADIERLVKERVQEQMQAFVTETRFCSRCGKDRLPQVRAEMLTSNLQK
jgi:hypothetical protein